MNVLHGALALTGVQDGILLQRAPLIAYSTQTVCRWVDNLGWAKLFFNWPLRPLWCGANIHYLEYVQGKFKDVTDVDFGLQLANYITFLVRSCQPGQHNGSFHLWQALLPTRVELPRNFTSSMNSGRVFWVCRECPSHNCWYWLRLVSTATPASFAATMPILASINTVRVELSAENLLLPLSVLVTVDVRPHFGLPNDGYCAAWCAKLHKGLLTASRWNDRGRIAHSRKNRG